MPGRGWMPDYGRYKELKLDFEGRLLTITLNRPEMRNALAGNMHLEPEEIWHDTAAADAVRVGLLTGAGDRAFSAGGDVKGMSRSAAARPSAARSFIAGKRILANMFEVEQPIIGAINGDAVGMGCTLAFSCDILVASERA